MRRRSTRALPVLVHSVKEQGFEGLVAKRRDSVYEPGLRSGAWLKMRVNRGQEFVIGGYTRGTRTFDALVFGILRRQGSHLRLQDPQRLHAAHALEALREVQGARDRRVPLCQPPRSPRRTLGPGAHQSEDGGVPVAEAGPRRTVRVPRMDRRQPFAALKLRRAARRQESEGRSARVILGLSPQRRELCVPRDDGTALFDAHLNIVCACKIRKGVAAQHQEAGLEAIGETPNLTVREHRAGR